MSDNAIRGLLARCVAENSPEITRELILDLLDYSDVNATLTLMRALVAELAVVSLHGSSSLENPMPSMPSPASSAQKSPTGGAYKGQAAGGKGSLVGTISLPRATFDEGQEDGSGSDIPSESSASSEDEGADDAYAEELWKQALTALKRGSQPEAASAADVSKRPQTHKDLFDSLIRDIEAEKTFHEV
eukprot:gene35234-42682_t